MPKKSPVILAEFEKQPFFKEQVLLADGLYAVFYKDQPINLRVFDQIKNLPSKYKKTTFANPGYALALAKELNREFNCKDFTVRELIPGNEYKKK